MRRGQRQSGFTLVEILTAVVALVVIVAVVITLWRTRDLRQRRVDAMEALEAVQVAQDRYFAEHARYADASLLTAQFPRGLGLRELSARGHYRLQLTVGEHGLGYLATARAVESTQRRPDTRCVELRLDQIGRRTAVNDQGADTSADCWNRL